MGICTSCHSTAVVTAKLILPDGRLQEFIYPTKVRDVLNKNPLIFICNADEMDFDDVVSPIKDHEELQPGQLYFALPLKRLKHPLQPEEMAALAVKASAALAKCSAGQRRKTNICFTTSRVKSSSRVADVETVGLGRRSCHSGGGGAGGGGGGKRGSFRVMLSAIPE
ncbi:hypothetical protein Hanom_Chr17g01569631 [Helianthus anomalus]